MPSTAVIDLPTFSALKDAMGADFLPDLLQAYFEETPKLLANLQDALASQDAEAFRRAAHSIKSSSNSFGAFQFGEMARELEMIGRQANLQHAHPRVAELVSAYSLVCQALEELLHA